MSAHTNPTTPAHPSPRVDQIPQRRQSARRSTAGRLVLIFLIAPLLLRCSVNPATGQRQLALMSEQQEIALGRDADQQFVNEVGMYPDQELQSYVSELGKKLAAQSERPHLPWTFRVADDPTVNAFALPGGYIYVTRGILAHLASEAELVSVLGHEIGHVTGRHSVEQLSKQQLASVGLVAGMVLSPDVARYGGLAQAGLGLLFLKYGRDDERESDALGLRYTVAGGYDPREMPKVFATLGRVSARAGAGRLPNWLASHPDSGDRATQINREIGALARDWSNARVGREAYVGRLDGMVFGADPREGFFEGRVFHHPGMQFSFTLPAGWQTKNAKQALTAIAPDQDAVVRLTLAKAASPEAAAQAFFARQNIARGDNVRGAFRSLAGQAAVFGVKGGEQGDLAGVVGFVAHRGQVLEILGYTRANQFSSYREALLATLRSFEQLTDRRKLTVEPSRVDVVKLDRAMTLEQFASRHPSTVDLQTLAILNGIEPGATLTAGTLAKRVTGGPTP